MMSLKTVAGLALLSKALALPMFYDQNKMGCEIPTEGFAGHMAPTEDPAIVFELSDAADIVMEWEAGMEYTLTVAAYDGVTNAWIHATTGTLAPVDATTHSVAACGDAVYSIVAQASHKVTWTAPATATGCVTVSSAQATGSTAGYSTGTATLCAAGAVQPTAVPPGGSVPVAAEPPMVDDAVEAEMEEGGAEDTVDDAVDDATDAVGDAAEEGADAADEVTNGAAGRTTIAALLASAAAVLAAAM